MAKLGLSSARILGATLFLIGAVLLVALWPHGVTKSPTVAVRRVVGWGLNVAGEVTGISPPVPQYSTGVVTIAGQVLTDVISIAAGQSLSLAIKSDGTIVGWGQGIRHRATWFGTNGVLMVNGQVLSNVVAVSIGQPQTFALLSDGTVASWMGDHAVRKSPVPGNESNVVAIAAGDNYHLALKQNSNVVSWGEGSRPPGWLSDVIEIAVCGFLTGWHWLSRAITPS